MPDEPIEVESSDESAGHTARGLGVPAWALAVLGILLAVVIAIGGTTLYLVAEIDDQAEQAADTAKTVATTKALVDVIAARQLKSQDVSAKVEGAVTEMTTLLNKTQDAIDATNEAIAATNETLDANIANGLEQLGSG